MSFYIRDGDLLNGKAGQILINGIEESFNIHPLVAKVWRLCNGKKHKREIIEHLKHDLGQMHMTGSVLKNSVDEIIRDLTEKKLIKEI